MFGVVLCGASLDSMYVVGGQFTIDNKSRSIVKQQSISCEPNADQPATLPAVHIRLAVDFFHPFITPKG